jgi:hypothetical protein
MDKESRESLVRWSAGRTAGVSLLSALALSSADAVREFLTLRRTRSGMFAADPVVNEFEWFDFYNSPKSLERGLLVGDAAPLLGILDTLRNPKKADDAAKLAAFGLIIAFFSEAGPRAWARFARCMRTDADDSGGVDEQLSTAEAFYLWIHAPCWFTYGVSPTKLMRRLSNGGKSAEKAAQRLVRLDPRVVRHRKILRWIKSDPAVAPFRRRKVREWAKRTPFDKEKSDTHAFRRIAGYLSAVSDLVDDRILAPEFRPLANALGHEFPADLQNYLLDRTDDDWSREVRRQRGHFELGVSRPDKSITALVREVARKVT